MLVQSNWPNILRLLPSLPSVFMRHQGLVYHYQARGNLTVSLYWSKGRVIVAELLIPRYHPWLHPIHNSKSMPGFLETETQISTDHSTSILITSPNQLLVLSEPILGISRAAPACIFKRQDNFFFSSNYTGIYGSLVPPDYDTQAPEAQKSEFQCILHLCSQELDALQCKALIDLKFKASD